MKTILPFLLVAGGLAIAYYYYQASQNVASTVSTVSNDVSAVGNIALPTIGIGAVILALFLF